MDTKISKAFWIDEAIETLDKDAKFCVLWLFTAHVNEAGWVECSQKRFQFETDCTTEDLARACEGLGKGVIVHKKGYWLRNYIRHQIGIGEPLAKNNQALAIIRMFKNMPAEIVEEVLLEYPELKVLPTPSKVLAKDRRGEERKGKARSQRRSPEEEIFNPQSHSLEQWAELCVNAYPKRDSPMECLQFALSALRAETDPQGMLNNIKSIRELIDKAPGGKSNGKVPSALNFFKNQQWLEPSNFTNRWQPNELKFDPQKKEGRPTVAIRVENHVDLPSPPCEWRDILKKLYPPEDFPTADYVQPWGLYPKDIRREIESEAKRQNLIPSDWKQSPIPEKP